MDILSLPMRERELKRKASAGLHPGARSLPMRERELKPCMLVAFFAALPVAPHAGA